MAFLRTHRVALLVAVCALLATLAMGVAATAEIVERGRLVGYSQDRIYRIEFLGGFQLLASRPADSPLDALNAIMLAVISGAAGLGALLLRAAAPVEGRLRLFFGILAAGTAALALDEAMELGETLGHNAQWLVALPGVSTPADLDLYLYGIPALAFALTFKDLLLSSARALRLWGAAVALFVVIALLDLMGPAAPVSIEEPAELVLSVALASGVVALCVDCVLPALSRPARGGTAHWSVDLRDAGRGRASARRVAQRSSAAPSS